MSKETSIFYWNCKCPTPNHVHSRVIDECPTCGCLANRRPDALLSEVVEYGFPVPTPFTEEALRKFDLDFFGMYSRKYEHLRYGQALFNEFSFDLFSGVAPIYNNDDDGECMSVAWMYLYRKNLGE